MDMLTVNIVKLIMLIQVAHKNIW